MWFLIIRKEALPKMPAAIREYMERYGEEKTILGIKSVCCERSVTEPRPHGYQRGHGPCHSLDVSFYKKGLRRGLNLNDWIRIYSRKHPENLVEIL